MTSDGLLFTEPTGAASDDWDEVASEAPVDENALYIELDGWEGPLDLLLDLARRQKVDLRSISILALVDQYLDYIDRAGALKLELAADYLVMAAWLAYLKSAMLLPKEEQEDPSPEELALKLQLRLQRLGAMRDAAARLMGGDRIGRDVFLRGSPEGLEIARKNLWQCDQFALIEAYGRVKARTAPAIHMVRERPWMELRDFLPPHAEPRLKRSALASSFVAALELARLGKAELQQDDTFGPLHLRRAPA